MADNFQKARHDEFNAPESAVLDIARRATGRQTTGREKIVAGYDNEVYRVPLRGTDSVIVRIRRFGERDFRQEAWAMERCREAGVPVADVLLLDSIEGGGQPLETMVVSEIRGRQLSTIIDSLTESDRIGILREAGETLRRIHSVKVEGFYRRHPGGQWDFPTWNALMDSAIHDRSRESDLLLSAGFTEAEFDFMIDMLKRYRNEFPCRQPVLNHGDYLPGHIFVDNEIHITGVIDFGMYEGAPPVHDFAYMDGRIELAPVIDGYDDRSLGDGSFPVRMHLHQVALGMGHVAHNMMIGNTRSAELSAQRLRNAVTGLRDF